MNYNFDQQLQRIGTNSWKWDQYGDPDIIAMSTAELDFKSADYVCQKLKEVAENGCFNYHFKPESYYETVIRWFKRRHNWDIEKDWLLNVPGVWASLHTSLMAFAKPGDNVIIQTPHFSPLRGVIERTGCHIVTNPMILKNGHYELDLADFEAKVAQTRPSVFLLINLQNPTGRLFTKEELLALNRICSKYNVITVSDEVHSNIVYENHVHHPAASISQEAMMNTVVVTAASKSYNLMDLTYCVLVIPNPELRRKYATVLTGYNWDFAVNIFSVAGLEAAFSENTDPWLDALNEYLYQNLLYLEDYFKKYIPRIKVIHPEGSYLVWLDCRELGLEPMELREFFLKKARVGLTWGDTYGEAGNGFERINIGCPRKTLEEGLGRIRKAVDAL